MAGTLLSMDQISNSKETRGVSRRRFLLSAIGVVVISACKSTIPQGSQRNAYRVSWHILKEIKKIQDPLSDQDVDMVIKSITDDNAREWALEWRNKKLIYLGRFENANAIILDPKQKSIETKKPYCLVMQKHLQSPKSVYKDEITE